MKKPNRSVRISPTREEWSDERDKIVVEYRVSKTWISVGTLRSNQSDFDDRLPELISLAEHRYATVKPWAV